MRPKAIVWFERLYVAALAVGALRLTIWWANWDRIMPNSNPAWIFAMQFALIGIMLMLVLLTARLRSRVAMWILILAYVYYLTGLPALALKIGVLDWVSIGSELFILVATSAAIGLLFTASARAWLRKQDLPSSPPGL